MTKKERAAQTPATVALTRAGVPFALRPYAHASGEEHYGDEAARALGVPPERVFKTLLVDAGGELVVGVVPVAGQLDLKALAAAVGAKRAALADPAVAERVTGMVVGGISPLGQRTRHRTVVDATALEHPTIHVSAGRRGLQVELTGADLVAATEATVAPIGR